MLAGGARGTITFSPDERRRPPERFVGCIHVGAYCHTVVVGKQLDDVTFRARVGKPMGMN